jgi:hypothetical protein
LAWKIFVSDFFWRECPGFLALRSGFLALQVEGLLAHNNDANDGHHNIVIVNNDGQ